MGVPRDHPRSRGVYGHGELVRPGRQGSSPLARGLRIHSASGVVGIRIIPARAGFTPTHRVSPTAAEDHPRSRGVYVADGGADLLKKGSSPLARGLQQDRRPEGRPTGIIPARAGFTVDPLDGVAVAEDHPRSRGVYSFK